MKLKGINAVFVFFLFGVLLTGCSDSAQVTETTSENPAEESNFEIDAWGEVKYNREYQINIDFTARVESIKVKEGDVVKKGDVLAVLDLTEFDNMLDKQEFSKEAAESVLNGTYQDTTGVEAQIVQKQKDITFAQRDADNYQILYDSGMVSQDELNQYISVLNNYQTELQVLQVELEQMRKDNVSNTDYQASELNSITKDLQTYLNKKDKDYLSDNNLVCNLDNAIVKAIYAKDGTLLGESNTAVIDLIDVDSIYISTEVEEEFIKYISQESSLRIVPTMNPDKELSGQIKQISAMAVEKDGNRIIKVQIVAEDPELLLKPGYTADVYIRPDENN